jgi:hypothetical protein
MTLPTRPLGASGMGITRVRFGVWAIGGAGRSGARRPAQIDGRIAAGGLELDDDDLDGIALARERSGAGEGPVRPIASASLA